MPEDQLLVIVDVGLRVGTPLGDAATTLPFQREDHDTERVMRVAPIDDEETAPPAPPEPAEAVELPVPITLAAGIDLVAIDRTPSRAPVTPATNRGVLLVVIALLIGSFVAGVVLGLRLFAA